MKYLVLLFTLLSLSGCFHATFYDTKPVQPPPIMVATGTDGDLDWRCELKELDESLVWVQCDFHNQTIAWAAAQNCVRVSFYNESDGKLVAQSRRVCSGLLPYQASSTNYAAFEKENRKALRKCGERLSSCVMLAGEDWPSLEERLKSRNK